MAASAWYYTRLDPESCMVLKLELELELGVLVRCSCKVLFIRHACATNMKETYAWAHWARLKAGP